MRLGVIADTHGLLRPEVFEVFAGVDHIIHAGDIGPLDILTELEAIAPVTAVFGNTDGFDLRAKLHRVARIELDVPNFIKTLNRQRNAPPSSVGFPTRAPQSKYVFCSNVHVIWPAKDRVNEPRSARVACETPRPATSIEMTVQFIVFCRTHRHSHQSRAQAKTGHRQPLQGDSRIP